MGATTFTAIGEGVTPDEAFRELVHLAQYEYGHGGYTGTIAEKAGFLQFSRPDGIAPDIDLEYAIEEAMSDPWAEDDADKSLSISMRDDDGEPVEIVLDVRSSAELRRIAQRVDDKWGPAGCLPLGDGRWLFFGWAST